MAKSDDDIEYGLLDDDELDGEDSTSTVKDDADTPEAQDESLADGNTEIEVELEDVGEERESIRERRRQERHDRKLRAKEREESLRRELNSKDSQLDELRQRLDIIDRRNSGSELAQLEQAKSRAAQEYNYYKDQIRVGTESQNGEAVAEATEKMYQIRSRMDQLLNHEKAISRVSQQPQPLDPRVANSARKWADENPWYDLQGKDQDSRVVLMLDQTLADERWNPSTPEYWDELNKRVKKYLPHRANRDNITSKQKSVVAGSGRETAPRGGDSTFRLSAERVKALKDANKWEDVEERNKMIKAFRDYDRNNANNEGAR